MFIIPITPSSFYNFFNILIPNLTYIKTNFPFIVRTIFATIYLFYGIKSFTYIFCIEYI